MTVHPHDHHDEDQPGLTTRPLTPADLDDLLTRQAAIETMAAGGG